MKTSCWKYIFTWIKQGFTHNLEKQNMVWQIKKRNVFSQEDNNIVFGSEIEFEKVKIEKLKIKVK